MPTRVIALATATQRFTWTKTHEYHFVPVMITLEDWYEYIYCLISFVLHRRSKSVNPIITFLPTAVSGIYFFFRQTSYPGAHQSNAIRIKYICVHRGSTITGVNILSLWRDDLYAIVFTYSVLAYHVTSIKHDVCFITENMTLFCAYVYIIGRFKDFFYDFNSLFYKIPK